MQLQFRCMLEHFIIVSNLGFRYSILGILHLELHSLELSNILSKLFAVIPAVPRSQSVHHLVTSNMLHLLNGIFP
jgi:hypothetical protein